MLGLLLSPFLTLKSIVDDIAEFQNPAADVVEERYPGFKTYFTAEILVGMLLLFFVVFIAVKFFRKKHDLPHLMICLLSVRFALAIINFSASTLIFHGELASVTAIGIREMIVTGIAAAIWIPYFLRSDRVALTFVMH